MRMSLCPAALLVAAVLDSAVADGGQVESKPLAGPGVPSPDTKPAAWRDLPVSPRPRPILLLADPTTVSPEMAVFPRLRMAPTTPTARRIGHLAQRVGECKAAFDHHIAMGHGRMGVIPGIAGTEVYFRHVTPRRFDLTDIMDE
jgi:hypothetical protein